MSKHMKARQFSETFYQHHLLLVAHAARMILDNIGETERTWEVEPYLIGDIAAAIWEMHHA